MTDFQPIVSKPRIMNHFNLRTVFGCITIASVVCTSADIAHGAIVSIGSVTGDQAVDLSGNEPGVQNVDAEGPLTDWLVFEPDGAGSLAIRDEKAGASNIGAITPPNIVGLSGPAQWTIFFTGDDSASGNSLGAPIQGTQSNNNVDPFTGTVSGLGTEGTFYIFAGEEFRSLALKVTISEAAGDTTTQVTGVGGGGVLFVVDYAEIVDPNATLEWSLSLEGAFGGFFQLYGVGLTAIPEPGTLSLLGVGGLCLFIRKRSR